MPEKQYNTTWYQPGEEPSVGMPCPKCKQGIIDESQFGGYWCKNCKWKWKLSKYPPKEKGGTPGTDKIVEELDQGKMILAGIKRIEDRFDKLANWIKGYLESKDDI